MADRISDSADINQIKSPRAAIVTTLKGAGPTAESWIVYHLHVGFDKLYLYFDDPEDSSIDSALKFDQKKVQLSCRRSSSEPHHLLCRYLSSNMIPSYENNGKSCLFTNVCFCIARL